MKRDNIGALIIRTELFGVDLYYNHNKESPKIVDVSPHQQKQEQLSMLMLLSWRLCLWRIQP